MRVARHRDITLASLSVVLAEYAPLAQQRWLMWLKKQRIESRVPAEFSTVLDLVTAFADPVIDVERHIGRWNSAERRWVTATR